MGLRGGVGGYCRICLNSCFIRQRASRFRIHIAAPGPQGPHERGPKYCYGMAQRSGSAKPHGTIFGPRPHLSSPLLSWENAWRWVVCCVKRAPSMYKKTLDGSAVSRGLDKKSRRPCCVIHPHPNRRPCRQRDAILCFVLTGLFFFLNSFPSPSPSALARACRGIPRDAHVVSIAIHFSPESRMGKGECSIICRSLSALPVLRCTRWTILCRRL